MNYPKIRILLKKMMNYIEDELSKDELASEEDELSFISLLFLRALYLKNTIIPEDYHIGLIEEHAGLNEEHLD